MLADDIGAKTCVISGNIVDADSRHTDQVTCANKGMRFDELTVLRQFFQHSVAASAILDKNFNFIQVNPVYAAADNRDVSDFPGRNHFDLYPSAENQAIFRQVVETGRPYQAFAKPFVYERNPERAVTYWDWSLVPVLNENQQVELLLLSLHDVTKRKRAELELERFFELSADMFCIIGMKDGRYQRLNPAFETTLGFSREELYAAPLWERIYAGDRDGFREKFNRLSNGERTCPLTFRHECKDGTYKWLRLNCVPVMEEQCIYAVARDITHEVQLQHEMVRFERLQLVTQMAAVIGHEVRNPMTAVRALLQLLASRPDLAAYRQQLTLALKELDRANDIVTRFLTLAREKPTCRQPDNPKDIVFELAPLIRASATEAGVDLQLDLRDVPDVLVDRNEICQVVLNLARNAIEAMPHGGTLTLRTLTVAGAAAIAVEDEGEGIKPEILSKIGTPFLTTKDNGTGLGIAVCRAIVDRHAGRMSIETGKNGTKVLVSFPCAT